NDLTGLAHGNSGVSAALIELYAVTGDERFSYAAKQGTAYEASLFSPAERNWLDLRHPELTSFLIGRDTNGAGVPKESSGVPRYRPHFQRTWCHGAPGIGLARLRAFELLRVEPYRREAVIAVASTLEEMQLRPLQADFSLCHGTGGLVETLLRAYEVLGDEVAMGIAASCAL